MPASIMKPYLHLELQCYYPRPSTSHPQQNNGKTKEMILEWMITELSVLAEIDRLRTFRLDIQLIACIFDGN